MNVPSPGARPSGARRIQVAALIVAAVFVAGVAVALASQGGHAQARAEAPTTTTTAERHPSTTASTTTTLQAEPDGVDRTTATDSLLTVLDAIPVQPEAARSGYDRSLFPHWDDEDHDGCDTRCEVLAAQKRSDGTWLSEWDGYVTSDPSELQIDHVVALAEAWDSGANTWTPAQRDQFADDQSNLLAVTASENDRKGDRDAAEWFPARAEADCLFASTTVRVKSHWSLSVDQAEHDALANLLHTCPDFVAPTTTTATPIPAAAPAPALVPEPAPAPAPAPSPEPEPPASDPGGGCEPGYSPCIPLGEGDIDCAGGKGNGPRYVEGPVYITGSDPYGLDGSDHDGVGCE